MNLPRKPAKRPTLEDLLHLKRAERPDEDFWHTFDHGLRQKQLAAIVEPKPWWLGLSLAVRKFALPLGALSGASAAAAALLAIIALAPASVAKRDPETRLAKSTFEPVVGASSQPSLIGLETAAALPDEAPSTALESAPALAPSLEYLGAVNRDQTLVAEGAAPVAPLVDERMNVAPASVDRQVRLASFASVSPTANFAPGAARISAAAHDPSAFVQGGVTEEDNLLEIADVTFGELAKFASDTELPDALGYVPDRQARLLAAPSVSSADTGAAVHARERIVRRLADSDDRYASAATRVGMQADRFLVRF